MLNKKNIAHLFQLSGRYYLELFMTGQKKNSHNQNEAKRFRGEHFPAVSCSKKDLIILDEIRLCDFY